MISVRRFSGPIADEIFWLYRPDDGGDASRQAERGYTALLESLSAQGASAETVVAETLWLRSARADLEAVGAARRRALGEVPYSPATTLIEQPPLSGAALEMSATAVVPRQAVARTAPDVAAVTNCACPGCSPGARARLLRSEHLDCLYVGNLYGAGRDPSEEVADLFRVADDLLVRTGFGFGDVVRTWIYLRHIDRDYDALNRARREFFERRGLQHRPASTGVQGGPAHQAHDFAMSLWAVKSPRSPSPVPLSTPLLSEAWTYGADFSRGLRVADPNKVALHISGTASIDEAGRTVHPGDLEAQIHRTLDNIESLLDRQRAGWSDLVSGTAYLPNAEDAPVLRRLLASRGLADFPGAWVEAPLCRPDLLCEIEALAVLPLSEGGT